MLFEGIDTWQWVFLAGASAVVVYQMIRGWRLGVVRELLSLASLGVAYVTAVAGGRHMVPLLRPSGLPDPVLQIAGGCVLALFVLFTSTLLGAMLLKKTEQHSGRAVRAGYGVAGSLLGAVSALIIVWMAALGIRLLGTIAETELNHDDIPSFRTRHRAGFALHQQQNAEVSPVVRGLAEMKQSLEKGPTGPVIKYVDPLPAGLYSTLRKLSLLINDPDRFDLFLKYPGTASLTAHPRIAALQNDSQIAEDLVAHNYLGLLRNENIVRAANDPELRAILCDFKLEQALDYALHQPLPPASVE